MASSQARTVIEIRADSKFIKISPASAMANVASKIAKQIYGKGINDCLGAGQNVLQKALQGVCIKVYAHSWESLPCKETKWIQSMVAHAQSKGVVVSLIEI
jgi:hypothetical protein